MNNVFPVNTCINSMNHSNMYKNELCGPLDQWPIAFTTKMCVNRVVY